LYTALVNVTSTLTDDRSYTDALLDTAAKADVMIPAIFKILRLLVLNHQFLSDTISQISFQPRGVVATAGRIDYLSFTFVCRFKTI
jgi:hypothetical protein